MYIKSKLRIIILFSLSILLINNALSQEWTNNIKSKNPTYKEIVQAFEDYWSDKTPSKGTGYKQFQRLKWYFETRQNEDGTLPASDIIWKEWNKYKENNIEKKVSINGNWKSVGPLVSTGGYMGLGRINCIAFHPVDTNIFWIGTPAGGLWKTIDGGNTWTTNTDDLPVLGISSIVINNSNPNQIYIATGDGESAYSMTSIGGLGEGDTKSIGVLKSNDGGNTWNTTGLSWNINNSRLIRKLIINQDNPLELLAATSKGIWKTDDGGNTWTNPILGYFTDIYFKPDNYNTVYAVTNSNNSNAILYRSNDGGENWTIIKQFSNVLRIKMALNLQNPNALELLTTNFSSGLEGVYKSVDSGNNFVKYVNGSCTLNYLSSDSLGIGCYGQGFYDLAFIINPNDSNEKYIGGVNTWNTIDNGNTWNLKTYWIDTNKTVETVHADKHIYEYNPINPNVLYEGNDGGIYKSYDKGNNWIDLSNGLQISQIYRLSVAQYDSNKVMIGMQDNGTRQNFPDNYNWKKTSGGDGMDNTFDNQDPDVLYSSYQYGHILRKRFSTNDSTYISNNIPGSANGPWITPFVLNPSNNNSIYAGYHQLYKSVDQGENWTAISNYVSDFIKIICVSEIDTNVIYICTTSDIFKTTDGGQNWVNIYNTSNLISYITLNPHNSNNIYVTLGGYTINKKVIKSIDGGLNWINISNGLPNLPANCIVYQKNSDDGLYLGTDVGVFYRDSTLNNWIEFNHLLPNVVITELEINYYDNTLWAGTFGRGVWKSDLHSNSNIGIEKNELNNIVNIFPNPNNGNFEIKVNNDKIKNIKIFDLIGNLVMVKENIDNDNSIISLNSTKNGVYIVEIELYNNNNKIINKIVIQ